MILLNIIPRQPASSKFWLILDTSTDSVIRRVNAISTRHILANTVLVRFCRVETVLVITIMAIFPESIAKGSLEKTVADYAA